MIHKTIAALAVALTLAAPDAFAPSETDIAPSPVTAVVSVDTELTAQPYGRGKRVAVLLPGDAVEILQDQSCEAYEVRAARTGQTGWLYARALTIPEDPPTDASVLTAAQIERFMNDAAYTSGSTYLLFTDVARQRLYVLQKDADGAWRLIKTFVCATGKNVSPTTRGVFTVSARGPWFYSNRFESGAKYWLRFNGTYLFHSVAMDARKNVTDAVLGERRSNGCVRLAIDDAKWLYDYIPAKTAVVVY